MTLHVNTERSWRLLRPMQAHRRVAALTPSPLTDHFDARLRRAPVIDTSRYTHPHWSRREVPHHGPS